MHGGLKMIKEKTSYSVKEAAMTLGVSAITIYRKVAVQEIPSRKIGSRVLIPADFIQNFGKVK